MNFFLKYLLWVPPEHGCLQIRCMLWGWVAIATSKEWYEYVSNKHCHRLGPFAWLTFYTSLIELSTVIKFSKGEFQGVIPSWVKCGWVVLAAVFLAGLLHAYRNGRRQKEREKEFNPYDPKIEIVVHSGKK
jgi:phosphatidylserine synthase 2